MLVTRNDDYIILKFVLSGTILCLLYAMATQIPFWGDIYFFTEILSIVEIFSGRLTKINNLSVIQQFFKFESCQMSIWPFHKQFSFTTKQEEYSPPNCLFDINPVTFKKYKKLSSCLQVDLASVEAPWADNKHLERFKFEWIEKIMPNLCIKLTNTTEK